MEEGYLQIERLGKEFASEYSPEGVAAVDDFSLSIRRGELVTLLGPSGCGKTTTLRMIGGFENPSRGSIYLEGRRINDIPANKRDTCMVFQSYALFPHMNIYKNVAYGLELRRLPAAKVRERVEGILELVGLQGLASRPVAQLSGGQQQRVALARAIVIEPKVLLFDEPLSNLDAKLRLKMRIFIRKIQQELEITSIYVTHDQEEAMTLSDRIVVMNGGRIEQCGRPEEIYSRPRNKFVADFIGKETNFLRARVLSREDGALEAEVLGRRVRLEGDRGEEPGSELLLVARPEMIELSEGGGPFSGEVSLVTYLGSHVGYEVQVEGREAPISVELYNPRGRSAFKAGDRVSLDFDWRRVSLVADGSADDD